MRHITALTTILFLCFCFPVQAKISANHKAGAIIIGPANDNECIIATEGAIRWNSAGSTHEMCDGTQWRRMITTTAPGEPSTPSSLPGYFVLSANLWNGGQSALGGPDALCLDDLTNNDWMGKADAQNRGLLVSNRVRAFLCTTAYCKNLLPGVTYHFAASGYPAIGGAPLTIGLDGSAPGDTVNWTGTNYFGADAYYWSGRALTGDPFFWGSTPHTSTSTAVCNNYNSTSGSHSARIGHTNRTDEARWNAGTGACSGTRHLLCVVDP